MKRKLMVTSGLSTPVTDPESGMNNMQTLSPKSGGYHRHPKRQALYVAEKLDERPLDNSNCFSFIRFTHMNMNRPQIEIS